MHKRHTLHTALTLMNASACISQELKIYNQWLLTLCYFVYNPQPYNLSCEPLSSSATISLSSYAIIN